MRSDENSTLSVRNRPSNERGYSVQVFVNYETMDNTVAHPPINDVHVKKISAWVSENTRGFRTAYDTWAFQRESEKTAFCLRWHGAK